MMRFEVCVEEGWPRRLVWCVVEASDLPAAVAGFYAMHGPACGVVLLVVLAVIDRERR